MKLKIFQVDAFASDIFAGNPAAVCLLENWLPDELMQAIAMENNLSETAFTVKSGDQYNIRWFTPALEVDLCGHATLASAYVIFEQWEPSANVIRFHSPRSGPLAVRRENDGRLTLDFPADSLEAIAEIPELNTAMGKMPENTLKGKTDILLIYEKQADIESLTPNFFLLKNLDVRGVIASAPGNKVDFVSRFFAPQSGVDEDPVTGSAHTSLTPYWSQRLDKTELRAAQLSKRGGALHCSIKGNRVFITGDAVLFMKGEIHLPDRLIPTD